MKILVAEDNSINIQVARYILSPLSSDLVFVMNGEEAIKKFSDGSFDLILMDVKMPVMDGCEATQEIRHIEKLRGDGGRIPIIAMTANNQHEEQQNCLKIGMDGFISKPFNTEDVTNMLKTLELI
ncbi:MAG TPA: response regulator [Prolixibacteraceae bacterium]|nr:response regulator [Prolixibacteraceae bacterium]HPS11882.1 response regulator [Prolixibacteraceae bacterium]